MKKQHIIIQDLLPIQILKNLWQAFEKYLLIKRMKFESTNAKRKIGFFFSLFQKKKLV